MAKAKETPETKEPAKAAAAVEETKEPAATKAAGMVAVKAIKPYHSIALKRRVAKGEVVSEVATERAEMLADMGLVEIIQD